MAVDTRLVLAALPLAAVALERKRQQRPDDAARQWWLDFRVAAPVPIWDYTLAIDEEMSADPAYPLEPDRWLEQHHPAWHDAVKALHYAFRHELDARLRYVQGEVLKWSEWRYGMHLACERQKAGTTKSVMYDGFVQEVAAQTLLNWTHHESTTNWPHPEQFLERWRTHGSSDPNILAAAGLYHAELHLLEEDN